MKIAIIGTRGIPNKYGGFEQFADFLSRNFVARGHDVSVYNSHNHPYQETDYHGVHIIHKYDPEYRIGTAGQFVYDLNCILDARKRHFDIILQLGYTSSFVWQFLLPKKVKIFTNMDGLEWKRTKFNEFTKRLLKFGEKIVAIKSDYLIADSKGIQKHLKNTYHVESRYIAYGTEIPEKYSKDVLLEYQLEPMKYHLIVARLEPENNIEMILQGFEKSSSKEIMVVIGKTDTKFGRYLVSTYKSAKIVFLGGVYNQDHLNSIRHYSNLYFHGHSVGGTNPSLLEAMGCCALVCAHDNDFNQEVLEENAYYFYNADQVASIINTVQRLNQVDKIEKNLQRLATNYSWEFIADEYEQYFLKSLQL